MVEQVHEQINYMGIWTLLIRNALLQYSDGEVNRFYRSINGLTASLLKEERVKVKEYKETLSGKNIDENNTLLVLEFIVDTLCEAGYLTRDKILELGTTEIIGDIK